MKNQTLGKHGESLAENYLISRNYRIIEKNYRCKYGEIDLIATKRGQLIFIEVKSRTSNKFGHPQESINYYKSSHIIKTALHFLSSTTKNHPKIWRVDLITLKLTKTGKLIEINHLKNIYGD